MYNESYWCGDYLVRDARERFLAWPPVLFDIDVHYAAAASDDVIGYYDE